MNSSATPRIRFGCREERENRWTPGPPTAGPRDPAREAWEPPAALAREPALGVSPTDSDADRTSDKLMLPDPPVEASPSIANALGLRDIARHAARDAERRALKEILDRVHWNRAEAARILRVSYKTLLNKIAQCGLGPGSRTRKS